MGLYHTHKLYLNIDTFWYKYNMHHNSINSTNLIETPSAVCVITREQSDD